MTRQWTQEELEALVYGELDAERAAELERLAERDGECAAELAMLREERQLMQGRARGFEDAAGRTSDLWSGIAARVAEADASAAKTPWWQRLFAGRAQGFGIGVAAAGLAAVALLAVTSPGGESTIATSPEPVGETADVAPSETVAKEPGAENADQLLDEAAVALSAAEMSHLQALDALEKAYRVQRESLDSELALKYDQEFAAARKTIEAARKTDDLHSRRRLLSAYSQQIMSLQAAMFDSQEPRR